MLTAPTPSERLGLKDMYTEYDTVEPLTFHAQLTTKFSPQPDGTIKLQDAWDVTVWKVEDSDLVPFEDIRIFTPRMVRDLTNAYDNKAPLAGVVARRKNDNGTFSYFIDEIDEIQFKVLNRLWDKHLSDETPSYGEDEEPF